METKPNQIIEVDGVKLKIVESSGCIGCYYFSSLCTKPKDRAILECVDASGDEVKSVIFKLIN